MIRSHALAATENAPHAQNECKHYAHPGRQEARQWVPTGDPIDIRVQLLQRLHGNLVLADRMQHTKIDRTKRAGVKAQKQQCPHLRLCSLVDDILQPSQSGLRRVVVHSFVFQFSDAGDVEHLRLIAEFIGLDARPRINNSLRAWSSRSRIGRCVLAHLGLFIAQVVLQDDGHGHKCVQSCAKRGRGSWSPHAARCEQRVSGELAPGMIASCCIAHGRRAATARLVLLTSPQAWRASAHLL